MIKINDTEIKERANNKIWSKIQMGQIHLEDLRQQLKAESYKPFIDEEQQRGLIDPSYPASDAWQHQWQSQRAALVC